MNTFPFTAAQINQFQSEMKAVGGFLKLMYAKEAIEIKRGLNIISVHSDIEKYKLKYLTGNYDSLYSIYDTDIPIIFWVELLNASL